MSGDSARRIGYHTLLVRRLSIVDPSAWLAALAYKLLALRQPLDSSTYECNHGLASLG
jgi:hypothetical protein